MQLSLTMIIVIVTVLVSIGAFNNPRIMEDLIFYPPAISKRNQWYRFFTSGFIHADAAHLAFNMISLYLFGEFVEERFVEIFGGRGKGLYLLMYVLALLVALLPTYIRHKDNYHYRGLGASGAVSAVVFSGLLIAPYIEVGLFLIPPFIPGFIFAPLYLIFSIVMARRGGDNINHSAHIWGAVFGLLFTIILSKLLADRNALEEFVNGVRSYMIYKGWI